MHYLVPAAGDFDPLLEVLKPAQVEFITPKTVREYMIGVHGKTTVVAAVDEVILAFLSAHATQLLEEYPSRIISVPGLIENADNAWSRNGAVFPPVDWMTFSKNMAKSGTVAHTAEDAEKRADDGPIAAGRLRIADMPTSEHGGLPAPAGDPDDGNPDWSE